MADLDHHSSELPLPFLLMQMVCTQQLQGGVGRYDAFDLTVRTEC